MFSQVKIFKVIKIKLAAPINAANLFRLCNQVVTLVIDTLKASLFTMQKILAAKR